MNKTITVRLPHELGRAEARRRIAEGLPSLASQIGAVGDIDYAWAADVLNFSVKAVGQTVTGSVAVADQTVDLEIHLSGVLALIAGKMTGRLRTQGQKLLQRR